MCMGSWAVLGRRASPVPRGKEADRSWHGGQARARLCPRLAHACPAGCWSPSRPRPHRWKRGRSSGTPLAQVSSRGRGPRTSAHTVCTGHPSSALPAAGDCPPGAGSGTRAVGAAAENSQPHFSVEMLPGKKCRFCNFKTPDESSVVSALRKPNGRTRQTRLGPPGRPALPASPRPRSGLAVTSQSRGGWAAVDVTPLSSAGSKR